MRNVSKPQSLIWSSKARNSSGCDVSTPSSGIGLLVVNAVVVVCIPVICPINVGDDIDVSMVFDFITVLNSSDGTPCKTDNTRDRSISGSFLSRLMQKKNRVSTC